MFRLLKPNLTWKGCPHARQGDRPHSLHLVRLPWALPSAPISLSCSPKHFAVIRRTLKKALLGIFFIREFLYFGHFGRELKEPSSTFLIICFFLRNINTLDTLGPNLKSPLRHFCIIFSFSGILIFWTLFAQTWRFSIWLTTIHELN